MNIVIFKSVFGNIKIKYNDYVVYEVSFTHKEETKIDNFGLFIKNEFDEYFNKERKYFSFKYEITGTPFQKEVYNELIKIPYAQTKTYQEIAINIKKPNAQRAVGTANNKNKLLFVIPCHRVIGKKSLCGYVSGVNVKEKLLRMESEFGG